MDGQETQPNQHVIFVWMWELRDRKSPRKFQVFQSGCQSLSDFMNRNKKVRGGSPFEDKMRESVLELFSSRCDWASNMWD